MEVPTVYVISTKQPSQASFNPTLRSITTLSKSFISPHRPTPAQIYNVNKFEGVGVSESLPNGFEMFRMSISKM